MRSIADALSAMLPAFPLLETETVPLLEAAGRYPAKDIEARIDSPPFDNSAMDGYAVRAAS